jgi:hypothetical protein
VFCQQSFWLWQRGKRKREARRAPLFARICFRLAATTAAAAIVTAAAIVVEKATATATANQQ